MPHVKYRSSTSSKTVCAAGRGAILGVSLFDDWLEILMNKSARCVAACAVGGAFALAPIDVLVPVAAADEVVEPYFGPYIPYPPGTGPNPLIPYGSTPYSPFRLGYVNVNHDEVYTTNGYLDVPF